MKNQRHKVSVIITCYNYADYVGEAIESVLDQTYKNIELIVIDDGSTDNSLSIINSYKDKTKIITRENKGIVYTRNEGLRVSGGAYIFFLDADDYFNSDYVEKMVDIAEQYKADVVYPNWHVFGDQEYHTDYAEFDVQLLIKQQIHCTSESLIRKDAISNHSFESEQVAEDWDFFLGLALSGKKFKLAKDCYINYRVRQNTRGASRPYWEDMYVFCKILNKWSEKYPAIVNPFDLPIHAGILRDGQIDALNDAKDKMTRLINENNNTIQHKDNEITVLRDELEKVHKSVSFRIGRVVVSPLSLIKKLSRK